MKSCVWAVVLFARAVCAQGAPEMPAWLNESPAELAKAARASGDARRGAVVFHSPLLACVKCHVGSDTERVGPNLTEHPDFKDKPDALDVHLVESFLLPSKAIRKGYETLIVRTQDGRILTGRLIEKSADGLLLHDPSGLGRRVAIPQGEIDEIKSSPNSLMPDGAAARLGTRQQFLDLIKYLIEIGEHGPRRALELKPDPSLYALPPLPEYEKRIDHAGLIGSWDRKGLERGRNIYERLCLSCHGTLEQPGSLPTSRRFGAEPFKNGGDPHSMYQTLTHGFGLMTPQTWLVPKQKYDVIHYVRETFLRDRNPTQYTRIDDAYLARLPKGDTRGPEPVDIRPWSMADYGPSLIATYGIEGANFAYKGIAVRLDTGPGGIARGKAFQVFDHDTLRSVAGWEGEGFIDWKGINFDGRHNIHPSIVGRVVFANPVGPGWADPATGKFDDPRPLGRDGRPYGPLPRAWARYRGLYHHGAQAIISYTVGDAAILEMPGRQLIGDGPAFAHTRDLEIGKSSRDLTLRLAPQNVSAALVGEGATLDVHAGFTVLKVPAASTPLRLRVLISPASVDALRTFAKTSAPPTALEPLTKGGPRRWTQAIKTKATLGSTDGAFAVDTLVDPKQNPWLCQIRTTGLDFLPDGKGAVVCTWDGDVWRVDGLDRRDGALDWTRIACGLFQPLGIKVIDGRVLVCCRDQLTILRDIDGDGETDFYECFNNDHHVTEHFHEFAMDLQVDAEGNLYYAKGARHALPALVPHHGTLLRVTKDGSRTDILATGFRAPNGVCVNRDGTFFVTDQEGHWLPKNRINLVKTGGFYGNMMGYVNVSDPSDRAMEQPLCWITNTFDRSPSELLWVDHPAWGPLKGSLLNLSYGNGRVFVVPNETVAGQAQGGMSPLPIPPFETGVMRGRFHAGSGHLYLCGMFAWAGSRTQPGGFYRVRPTGKPTHAPIRLNARRDELAIGFTDAPDRKSAADPANWSVKVWGLKRSAGYGSKHIDERSLTVAAVKVSDDGRSVSLSIPGLAPTWCMEVKYSFVGADGARVEGMIHNTIHRLGD